MQRTLVFLAVTANLVLVVTSAANKCGKDEVYSTCVNGGCDKRNCTQVNDPQICIDPIKCKTGYVCRENYLRAENGTCIPQEKCPDASCKGDPNAKPGCGVNCGRRCSDYNKPGVACTLICYLDGCDCKDKYVYDDNVKKCVLPKDCTPVCKQHEVYSECINGGCDARNCTQLGQPVPCVKLNPSACIKGCVCEEGYLRANNGTCIPKNQCPSCGMNEVYDDCPSNCTPGTCDVIGKSYSCPLETHDNCKGSCVCKRNYFKNELKQCISIDECSKCKGQNEVYDLCPSTCPPQTCESIDKVYHCPLKTTNDSCKPECRCLPGYYRNKIGQCISKDECLKCNGPNEYFSCGGACDNVCATLSKQNQTNCPIINVTCNKKCYCEKDYARDANNTCIPIKQCPAKQCKKNEVYAECPDMCQPQKCSQLGFPLACPIQAQDGRCPTKPACVCIEGYLKNDKGICVPKKECPSCGGDPNAKSGCGLNCGRLCSNYDKGPAACPRICKVNACDCKDKYVYDEDKKKCVLPKNCSPCTRTTTSTTTTTEAPVQQENTSLERLDGGNTAFTLNFLYQMITKNAGSSVVMSPFSVLIPLAQLALYSAPGNSYNQLMSVLNLNNKDEIRSVFPELLSLLKSQTEAILDLGAKIYVNKNFQLTDNFKQDTRDVFNAEAEDVDFSNSQQAADTINAWVEEITRGLIKNLVNPSMFSSMTRLVLTNAIYFLGNWQKQFNPNDTQTDDFYLTNDKTVQVPMMFLEGTFRYADSSDLDSQILEIPYKGGNFSYVIFVPKQNDGYSAVAEKIRNPEVLNKALDLLNYEKCHLYMPRHEITSTIDLVDILSESNVTDIFDDSKSGLTGILTDSTSLGVSAAVQKAFIKVDETGTEAAAANAITVGTTSVGVPTTVYTVKANKSFIFFLFLNKKPLFCGAYAGSQ